MKIEGILDQVIYRDSATEAVWYRGIRLKTEGEAHMVALLLELELKHHGYNVVASAETEEDFQSFMVKTKKAVKGYIVQVYYPR